MRDLLFNNLKLDNSVVDPQWLQYGSGFGPTLIRIHADPVFRTLVRLCRHQKVKFDMTNILYAQ
jgi:hypothetical protein